MFTDTYKARLLKEKYTRWAADLNEDQLAALFWAIGEFGSRAGGFLKEIEDHAEELLPNDIGLMRAKLGLDFIAQVYAGQRYSVEDVTETMRALINEYYAPGTPPSDHEDPPANPPKEG